MDDLFELSPALPVFHHNPSDTTIRKPTATPELNAFSKSPYTKPETVHEEGEETIYAIPSANLTYGLRNFTPPPPPIQKSHSSSSQKQPPTHPVRTPARTKRRSVSSTLSDDGPSSPTVANSPDPQTFPTTIGDDRVDFSSLLSTPAPIIFSTPVERELLNTLSMLGLDTAQIVHSVLTDACDAAGAVWWMLKKKAERRGLGLRIGEGGGEGLGLGLQESGGPTGNAEAVKGMVLGGEGVDSPKELDSLLLDQENMKKKSDLAQQKSQHHRHRDKDQDKDRDKDKKHRKVTAGVQTDATELTIFPARSAPQLAFVPPTPTFLEPRTPPPRPATPTGTGSRSLMLSPSSSTVTDSHSHSSSKHSYSSSKSHPSTPAGSLRDREKDKGVDGLGGGSKGRKARSGSVSIMQRATTALEAAGLVRKKSAEAVREEKERDKSKEMDRRTGGHSGEEPRSSHGSGGPSKLAKSPPTKAKDKDKDKDKDRERERERNLIVTPPPGEIPLMGSPWVMADSRDSATSHSHQSHANPRGSTTSPTPAEKPSSGDRGEVPHSASAPNVSTKISPNGVPQPRHRANLLTAFRLWFNEDRKGKRKDTNIDSPNINTHTVYRQQSYTGAAPKRRGSNTSGGRFGSRGASHRHRPSVSSRRSSSVNSRRSSGTSTQMLVLDSPQIPTRRSFGSHTPNSERGDHSSRPSSVRSFSIQGQQTQTRHRKSPSASSAGSAHLRTASPMQRYNHNHRRAGSGSSTRVVRQIQATPRPAHIRSNSTTSSLHSPASSRPASFYELSESEGPRTGSPYRQRHKRLTDDGNSTPRRGSSSGGSTNTTFVAQKRQGPFTSPVVHGSSYGRTSWKKSWGLEPPGWQFRTAHLPVEVLVISPATEPMSIRDVFSGRQSLSMGDESDWVDEDDDIPAFIGGLGQMGTGGLSTGTNTSGSSQMTMEHPPTVMLSSAPRGHRSSKRGSGSGNRSSGAGGTTTGKKQGHSPVERTSPNPTDGGYDTTETRTGRRQLPAGRSGPAFRHPIQEEDEGEEE